MWFAWFTFYRMNKWPPDTVNCFLSFHTVGLLHRMALALMSPTDEDRRKTKISHYRKSTRIFGSGPALSLALFHSTTDLYDPRHQRTQHDGTTHHLSVRQSAMTWTQSVKKVECWRDTNRSTYTQLAVAEPATMVCCCTNNRPHAYYPPSEAYQSAKSHPSPTYRGYL